MGGLLVTFPVLTPSVTVESLREGTGEEQWAAPAHDHLLRASRARVQMLAITRRTNDWKAIVLRTATSLSALGIGLLLVAVLIALVHRH